MENKLSLQKNIYRAFFAVAMVVSVCMTALSFYLYYFNYQSDTGVFVRGSAMTVYYILGAVAILSGIIFSFVPAFSMASRNLPKSGGGIILFNSFCGFFVAAYTVLEILNVREQGVAIPIWLWIMAFSAVVGSLYFHYQTISSNPNKITLAIFGMFMIIFIIINIYAVHYTATDILLNAPTRIGSLVAMTAIMMFLINEVRYHFDIANPRVYFAFSMLAAVFALSDSLPRIALSIMEHNGFEMGSATLLLCFEFFMAVYAIYRLAQYLKNGMFILPVSQAEESSDFSEVDTEDEASDEAVENDVYFEKPSEISENSENSENIEQSVDEGDADDVSENDEFAEGVESDSETDAEEGTEYDSFTDFKNGSEYEDDDVLPDEVWDVGNGDSGEFKVNEGYDGDGDSSEEDKKSDEENFMNDTDENDLPDDFGFEGGNEGEFEVEGFATVEESVSDMDDDIDDDEDEDESDLSDTHSIAALDIDDEEFNDMIADEGEIIDYEELKSSSADDINLEKPEEDDDDDDSVIEMDVLKLLSGEDENENSENNESEGENKPEGEKNEKKTLIQKFKFVKKV